MPSRASRLWTICFGTRRRIAGSFVLAAAVFASLSVVIAYGYITSGGLIARKSPSSIESFIARKLVNLSIPTAQRDLRNPLSDVADSTDVAAGRALYVQSCQACHGADGMGKTAAGGGMYPPPPDLHGESTARRTDGAVFYLIRNGIRNTGMPGWQLTDQQTWQLVSYIRNLPEVARDQSIAPQITAAHYVGSAACAGCHQQVYDHWQTTLMANVVRDPKLHPDAIIPDLTKPNPLVTFTRDDIAFVYGSKWKQRYFKKVGDDYFPLGAQWDVTHKAWKPYLVKDDWWVAHYPPENPKRPTGPTCDGCHSVNYDVTTKSVTEWNVGCEKCHGPGSEHLKNPVATTIINPARLDYVQGNDTCIQCHSQGRPVTNPVGDRYYDWPVGFHMGKNLRDYWKLEDHTLGQTTFTHFADGTAHKNRMQGNDFVTSQMYAHGVTCYTCHDSHGTSHESMLRKPAQALCLDCHGPTSPNGPHSATLEAHTHHKPDSPGSECIACHMPKIAQEIADVNVRSHTFRFVSPAVSETSKVPNACNVCHADKSNSWTSDVLKGWKDRSPWRVGG